MTSAIHSRRWRFVIRAAFARRLAEVGSLPCGFCGEPVTPADSWDLDHAIPRALGGGDEPWNLRVAHHFCNRYGRPAVPSPSRSW